MRSNKHKEFLKSIRILDEAKTKGNDGYQNQHGNPKNKMTTQEEYDLQKELERRFDELFGTTEED